MGLPSGKSVWQQPNGSADLLPFRPEVRDLGQTFAGPAHGWTDTHAAWNARGAAVIDWVTVPGHKETMTDDSELIAASLAEPARFAELFDRHYPAIHRYLRRRVGSQLADDLAAETFLLAFRQRARYRPVHPDAIAWLYGIAGNLVRHHARCEQRRLRAYARAGSDEVGPDASDGVVERLDAAVAVRRAAAVLADLPAAQREVVLLSAWTDLDRAGIARALGVSPATVGSRLHRARKRLRRQLGWAALDELAGVDPTAPWRTRHERA